MAEINRIRAEGEIIATGVSYEDFLTGFDGQRVEWVYGDVVQMSPVSKKHNDITVFLTLVFKAYLGKTGGGEVLHDPMTMRPGTDLPGRAPDIQVVLPENTAIIKENEVAGAADLVVEVVSPGSHRQDRVVKFYEYEKAGVKEYWILDAVREESLFYQLNEKSVFEHVEPDENGIYHSKVLPRLRLDVNIFWRESLPEFWEIAEMVAAMLEDKTE